MSYGKTLLFVYNSDSGMVSGLKDYAKISTVSGRDVCNLSAITFSPIGMKKDWKRFIRETGYPSRFLTRNEFLSEAGTGFTTFPAVLIQAGKELLLVASTDEINRCQCLEDLISLVRGRLAALCGSDDPGVFPLHG